MSDQVPIENQQQIPDQIQIDPTTTNNNDDGQDYSNKMEQVEQEAAKLREQLQAESTNNGVSFLTDEQKEILIQDLYILVMLIMVLFQLNYNNIFQVLV